MGVALLTGKLEGERLAVAATEALRAEMAKTRGPAQIFARGADARDLVAFDDDCLIGEHGARLDVEQAAGMKVPALMRDVYTHRGAAYWSDGATKRISTLRSRSS